MVCSVEGRDGTIIWYARWKVDKTVERNMVLEAVFSIGRKL